MDEKIKRGLRSLTYGLYVVTVDDGAKRNAMVASWVSQVSFDPPRIMAAIKKVRPAHNILTEAFASGEIGFGLMVVQRGKEGDLPRIKAEGPDETFGKENVTRGKSGAPLFADYLCAFDLKLIDTYDAGDHTLFIGEVVDVALTGEGTPSSTLDYKKVYIGEK
jgi:flavin reductase (DIM6/NTAB) family NADH-FMN oxidoreductase RutF